MYEMVSAAPLMQHVSGYSAEPVERKAVVAFSSY